MSGRFAGRVALVTGGTSGIGAGVVRRLTADGAQVAFTGSNREAADRLTAQTGAVFYAHRVEDAGGWVTLMETLGERFGRLDIAFANAGIETGDGSVESISIESWNRIVAINLTGVMLTAQAVIPVMRNNPGGPVGSIIVNSSMSAYRPMGNFVAYSTTKGALIALTKSIAIHCANQNLQIRCNSIHPGVVETDMIRTVIERAPDPAAARAQFEGMAPLKRMARVEEIAGLVAFLASDEAAFVSGSEYSIDGASTGRDDGRMKPLDGRVALISGGLRGIGLAIGERYVAEGAAVVLTDLAAANDPLVGATLERLGPAVSYLALDVAQEADWQAAERATRERHGRLDILVNNAGTDLTGAVETLEFAAWRRIMSINVDGVFLGTKTFTTLLAASGATTPFGSSIINVSSIMGLVGYSETSAYNASKGAVRLFSKSTAIEFATKRTPIRVNSIHPGFVNTPLLEVGMQKWVALGMAEKAQDLIDALAAATPNGRIAEPAEIAGAALFLASDDSSYCTGSELVIDGGWTAR